jgi:hypothetical protein
MEQFRSKLGQFSKMKLQPKSLHNRSQKPLKNPDKTAYVTNPIKITISSPKSFAQYQREIC